MDPRPKRKLFGGAEAGGRDTPADQSTVGPDVFGSGNDVRHHGRWRIGFVGGFVDVAVLPAGKQRGMRFSGQQIEAAALLSPGVEAARIGQNAEGMGIIAASPQARRSFRTAPWLSGGGGAVSLFGSWWLGGRKSASRVLRRWRRFPHPRSSYHRRSSWGSSYRLNIIHSIVCRVF